MSLLFSVIFLILAYFANVALWPTYLFIILLILGAVCLIYFLAKHGVLGDTMEEMTDHLFDSRPSSGSGHGDSNFFNFLDDDD